jgi:hypothetical protein
MSTEAIAFVGEKEFTETEWPEEFYVTCGVIYEMLKERGAISYADVVRAYPELRRYVGDAFNELRVGRLAEWDEWRPMPTRIRLGAGVPDRRVMKRWSHGHLFRQFEKKGVFKEWVDKAA